MQPRLFKLSKFLANLTFHFIIFFTVRERRANKEMGGGAGKELRLLCLWRVWCSNWKKQDVHYRLGTCDIFHSVNSTVSGLLVWIVQMIEYGVIFLLLDGVWSICISLQSTSDITKEEVALNRFFSWKSITMRTKSTSSWLDTVLVWRSSCRQQKHLVCHT